MSTHLTASWTYEPTTQSRYGWIVLTSDFDEHSGSGVVVCRVSDGLDESFPRLLAAAPDLLAALKETLACVLTKCPGTPNCVIRAEAAIAKAEGGAA